MRFEDAVKSWYDSAINCRRNDAAKPLVLPAQCVSQSLLNSGYSGLRPIDSARFVFVTPDAMGYAPAPLAAPDPGLEQLERAEQLLRPPAKP